MSKEVKTISIDDLRKELKGLSKIELAQKALQKQFTETAEETLELFYDILGMKPAGHINTVTKKEYTNGNVWALELAMILGGFASCEWATFNQYSGAGRSIIKGSKASKICVAVFGRDKKQEENSQKPEEKEKLKFFKGGSVFNIEQTEESEYKQEKKETKKDLFENYAVVA